MINFNLNCGSFIINDDNSNYISDNIQRQIDSKLCRKDILNNEQELDDNIIIKAMHK